MSSGNKKGFHLIEQETIGQRIVRGKAVDKSFVRVILQGSHNPGQRVLQTPSEATDAMLPRDGHQLVIRWLVRRSKNDFPTGIARSSGTEHDHRQTGNRKHCLSG